MRGPGLSQDVTSRDVARIANVSQSTVSRVVNNLPSVRPVTRARVEAAMKALGYVPNNSARSLITRQTRLLGLIVSNITNGFYPEIIETITSTAVADGYTVIVGSAGERPSSQAAYLRLLAEQRVDGVILTSTLPGEDAFQGLAASGLAIVLANRVPDGMPLDSVALDNVAAGRLATEHLIGHGRRRIAFVGGKPEASTNVGRLAGYEAALHAAGLPVDRDLIRSDEFTAEAGARQVAAMLDRTSFDAVFAADDTVALGCLDALATAGLSVPGDVAVVGIDDIAASRLRPISLTTISSAAREMGTTAVALLLARIRDHYDGPPRHVDIAPLLVIRSSCGLHPDSA